LGPLLFFEQLFQGWKDDGSEAQVPIEIHCGAIILKNQTKKPPPPLPGRLEP
jgi:hypothetical protein